MARLGSHLSEATKAKLSVARMGNKHALGYHHSDEAKAKIRAATLGANNPFFGRHHTAELHAKLLAIHKGSHSSEETKVKLRAASKTRWQDPQQRANKSATMIGNKCALGHHPTAEAKAKIRATLKGRPFSDSHLRNLNLKPNKAEIRLRDILDRYFPNTWKFVGDGQLIIGGRLPDFANINGKKEVIELFGAHWHPIFDVAEKKDHYRQYGFKVAIIWEDELKDEGRLVKTFRGKFKE